MPEDGNLLREIQKDYKDAKSGKKKRKSKAQLELEKIEEAKSLKNRILLMITAFFIFVAGVVYCAERYVDWRVSHEWQFPAKWVGLVRRIEKPTVEEAIAEGQVKQLTDIEVIDQYYLAPVLRSIYLLESTEGKNDGCKDSGMYNGFGFRQNSSEHKCYDTFEEVVEEVNEWLEIELAYNGNNLAIAACYYNTGRRVSSCGDYSENFWSVISRYF